MGTDMVLTLPSQEGARLRFMLRRLRREPGQVNRMQQKPTGIAGISKSVATSSILLLRPRGHINTDRVAKTIACCDGVQHVSLSSGEFGFVVAAKHNGSGIDEVKRSIRAALKGADMVTVTNHYVYSRTKGHKRNKARNYQP